MADPGRIFGAIVAGEYERAFYASQYAVVAPLFERYGVLLSIDDQRHALFSEHITRANEGCGFGLLVAPGRNPGPDPK